MKLLVQIRQAQVRRLTQRIRLAVLVIVSDVAATLHRRSWSRNPVNNGGIALHRVVGQTIDKPGFARAAARLAVVVNVRRKPRRQFVREVVSDLEHSVVAAPIRPNRGGTVGNQPVLIHSVVLKIAEQGKLFQGRTQVVTSIEGAKCAAG